ncbi:NAD-dependent epimerase/dehydratase family protein, partial [Streptococcus pneumoniae]|nr:NAD-dependent epimerase/dehydratase family protein [Streptococcus pneumoniae]
MKSKIILKNKTILVTGAAGFIGANLVMSLLQEENPLQIIGIDNLNDYYDVSLKEYRLSTIQEECQ